MAEVGMHQAKTQLSKLVERALDGEDIVVTRHGKPAVRLVPAEQAGGLASLAGAWKGSVHIADDFDELPADVADALGMHP